MNAALGRIALTVAAAVWFAANAVAADPAPSHHYRASTIESMKVLNAAGEDIGKIKDLVIDFNSGKVQYAALDFGGFLGIGDKLFAVPWSSFKYVEGSGRADRHLVLNVNKEQLKNAPGFDKNHWPDMASSNWTMEVDKYYKNLKQ
jgi:sporulation protein YlmC with PRC-barrel domain